MRSRLTKTIILIVFVVFLGIKNVKADEITELPRMSRNILNNFVIADVHDAEINGTYEPEDSNQYGNNVKPLTPGEEGPVTCGTIKNIPANIPKVTKIIYLILQVLVPIALIIFGMLDLVKGVMAQKEDEIKKGQQTFVKRLIAATLVFFVFAIVKMFASFLQDSTTVTDCLNCFISGECSEAEESPAESEEK